MEDVKRMNAEKRHLKNQTVKVYKMLGRKADLLPWKEITQEIPDVIETIEKIDAEKFRPSKVSAFVDGIDYAEEPSPSLSEGQSSIEAEKQGAEVLSSSVDGPVQQGLPIKKAEEKAAIVDPRTGLSRPSNGAFFSNEWEYYDWYRAVEKESPGTLNDADWRYIEGYEASEEWREHYGERGYGRMARELIEESRSPNIQP
jgi:hypothetical protein